MAISNNNALDQLFSMAFGGNDWAVKAMMMAPMEDLAATAILARDHAANALLQLESLGRLIGQGTNDDLQEGDVSRLGWLVAEKAELASVCLHLGEVAESLQDPTLRKAWPAATEAELVEMPAIALVR